MGSAIFNIAIGAFMLIAGATGKLVLFGTSSSTLLAVLGGGIAALGLFQLVRRLGRPE